MPLVLRKQAKKAFRDLIEAAHETPPPCMTSHTPERWTGWLGDDGIEYLPTDEEADGMCSGCPLRDKECREWKSKGDSTFGVLNGVVLDLHSDAQRGNYYETKGE